MTKRGRKARKKKSNISGVHKNKYESVIGKLGKKQLAKRKKHWHILESVEKLEDKVGGEIKLMSSENFEIIEKEGYFVKSTNSENIVTSVKYQPDNPIPTYYLRYRTGFGGKYFYLLPPKYFNLPPDLEQNRQKIIQEMDEISSLIHKFKSERGE